MTGELEKLSEDDPAATEAVIEKTTDSSKEEKDANVVVNERNNVLNLLESYKEVIICLQQANGQYSGHFLEDQENIGKRSSACIIWPKVV